MSKRRLIAGPNFAKYSSATCTSSAATVSRNGGSITPGASGLFRYVLCHMKRPTTPDPPTMTTGGRPIALYPAAAVMRMKAAAAARLKVCAARDVCWLTVIAASA